MGWAHGEKHGIRPGFSFIKGKARDDGVYVFSIVPLAAIITPCFLTEIDGAYKCVVSFLESKRRVIVSGLKDKQGKNRPRSFIILDGNDIKNIEDEEFKPVDTIPSRPMQKVNDPIPKEISSYAPQEERSFVPRSLETFPDHIPEFVKDLIMSVRSGNDKKEQAL